nr:ATP-binding cassette domain-containing protein [uncultured Ruminococcus sp.]
MAEIRIEHLSFAYPETDHLALKDVSITIQSGQFAVICGTSGSGKSTLLRLLKPSVRPHGKTEGVVFYDSVRLESLSHREESEKIGFVQQSPENQIVTDKVWHELAFGLESLGLSNAAIRRRVAETTAFFGLESVFEKNVSELSGGQKQLVTLASVMAMQPEVLILDEPTSQLDPVAAAEFLSCLHRISRELGVTVILCEQRLEEVFPLCDKVLLLEKGRALAQGSPQHIYQSLQQTEQTWALMPSFACIWNETGREGNCPLNIAKGREWLKSYAAMHDTLPLYQEDIPESGEPVLEVKDLRFRYQKDAPDILKGLHLKAKRGEFIAILGGNGAGKSTLLSVISGVQRAYHGKISKHYRRCATLPQSPRSILSGKTVRHSLEEIEGTDKIQMARIIALCRLESLLDRHPFDLSGGETQRAALAKVLLTNPDLLLLDEPTKGLDNTFKEQFAAIIHSLVARGVTVMMVSHDVEFCAKHPHRCLMLFGGELVAEGTPREFFSGNSFYVTSARRMAKGVLEDAVTIEDVLYCCTGKRGKKTPQLPNIPYELPPETTVDNSRNKLPLWKKLLAVIGAAALISGILINIDVIPLSLPLWGKLMCILLPLGMEMLALSDISKKTIVYDHREKLPKRTIAASLMILLAVPLTIFIGTTYLNDQKYLFISLFLDPVAEVGIGEHGGDGLALFVVENVVLTDGMVGEFLTVHFQFVALGGEAGFITGAIAMLVSNLYFGQGAWTPWQMFAAGIIGYLAGILFQKGFLRRSRGSLCVFGFIVTVMIYGLVMNFATMVLVRAPMNTESIIAYYAQGLPMDVIHALSTLVILFFAAEPMLEKLDHVKTKYGLLRTAGD